MAVWPENIPFLPEQAFRLMRWQGYSSELTVLTAKPPITLRGAGNRWHNHPGMELTIVTAGKGLRYVGDHAGPFAAKDCVLLVPRLPHCWVMRGKSSGYVLQFHFPPEHGVWRLDGKAELHALFKAARRGLQFGEAVSADALLLLKRLPEATSLARVGLLLELFGLLYGALQREATPLSRADYGAAAGATVSPKLEGVVQWILEHFHEPITVTEALSRAGMSPATFTRQFKRDTGKTFVEFLNEARLTHAHQQLCSGHHSVAEIAFEAGFNSLSHFGALFRARYGLTPHQLRAKG